VRWGPTCIEIIVEAHQNLAVQPQMFWNIGGLFVEEGQKYDAFSEAQSTHSTREDRPLILYFLILQYPAMTPKSTVCSIYADYHCTVKLGIVGTR